MKAQTIINRSAVEEPISKTKECVFSPEDCQTIFTDYNDTNRPYSKSLARLYANEFLRGAWHFNGENIIFAIDPEGNEHLVSGQHRFGGFLIACELFEKNKEQWPNALLEFRVNVTTGVDLEVADSVDTGKSRNHSDVLYRNPLVDTYITAEWNSNTSRRNRWCKCLATAARVVWQRQGGKTVSSAEKFVTSEMLTFIADEHPGLPTFVTMVMNADDGDGGHGGMKKISTAYMAAFCYLASLDAEGNEVGESVDAIEVFLSQVATGTGFSTGDASHAITGYWNSLPAGSKDRDTEVCGPLVKCLNALLSQEKTSASKLKLNAKELKSYKEVPPLLAGWDTAMFEYAAEVRADEVAAKEAAKEEREAAKEAAKAERERLKAEKELEQAEGSGKKKVSKKKVAKKKVAKKKATTVKPEDIPVDDEKWE